MFIICALPSFVKQEEALGLALAKQLDMTSRLEAKKEKPPSSVYILQFFPLTQRGDFLFSA